MQVKFDKTSPAWENDPKYNEMFIETRRVYLNDLLRVRGYVTLMEVLDALTIPLDDATIWDRRLRDLTWFRDENPFIVFGLVSMDDGSISITINID